MLKNANQYYDEQLIDFFKKLSNPDSVIKYKSNERVFKCDEWRHSRFDSDAKVSHYILDYRIVCDTFYFGCNYSWKSEIDLYKSQTIIDDICTIANNLGFEPIWKENREYAKEYGKKYTIKCKLAKHGILFEYRVYKNGNVHFKFNKEFAKAMNVEVSRLLGWIRTKEDIKKEFPAEMADGAEKYFKQNYTCIGCNTLLLTTKKPQIEHTTDLEQLSITINQDYKECLNIILNQIDNFNVIIEENTFFLNKCLEILKTQKGFIYRNCLITKQEDKTKIEFREMADLNAFENLLKEVA